jgi:hypothetical protein
LTRLAAMPGNQYGALALVLVVSVVGLSGCGSSADKTIPPSDSQTLISELNAVQDAAASGDCATAQSKATAFVATVNNLPETAGTDVKDALRGAGQQLEQLAKDPSQCQVTGATGASGVQTTPQAPATTTESTTTTTTSTTSTTQPAPPNGEGNQGVGGEGGQGGGAAGGGAGGTGGTGGPASTGGTGG